ncbi:hypothetical protein [Isoptericola haloaureus]|uniref:Uncharacterized protein n=1 Tax=Isoptericola haloaureus TaxID=1542902 RepID=A0ABU7Z7X1_9MICO
MIPTMIVLGLLLGRWWRSALLTATLLWPVLLVVDGAVPLTDPAALLGGALLGALNAAVGAAVVQCVRWIVRGVRAVGLREAGRRTAVAPSSRG